MIHQPANTPRGRPSASPLHISSIYRARSTPGKVWLFGLVYWEPLLSSEIGVRKGALTLRRKVPITASEERDEIY